MTEKACIKCGEVKALTEYYKNIHMADGRVNVCRACKLNYDRNQRRQTAEFSRLFQTWGRV